jgi:hypothetical protein
MAQDRFSVVYPSPSRGTPRGPTLLSRRQVLLSGLAATTGAALLGGCGAGDPGDGPGDAAEPGPAPEGVGGPTFALAQFFGGRIFEAGTEVRAPFGVADRDGLLPPERVPEVLRVQVHDASDTALGRPLEVRRHDEGLPRSYYPLRFKVDAPGIYVARTTVSGHPAEMSLQVHDAADLELIRPGSPLPALETPTAGDARGVHPICTREPACELHDLTVAAALREARPLALLVATPAFCQIAICGPVLDILLDVAADRPEVRYLHAEVFAAPFERPGEQAPVMRDLGLHFEPVLVLVGADGVVRDRLDVIFDSVELRDRLDRLVEGG